MKLTQLLVNRTSSFRVSEHWKRLTFSVVTSNYRQFIIPTRSIFLRKRFYLLCGPNFYEMFCVILRNQPCCIIFQMILLSGCTSIVFSFNFILYYKISMTSFPTKYIVVPSNCFLPARCRRGMRTGRILVLLYSFFHTQFTSSNIQSSRFTST